VEKPRPEIEGLFGTPDLLLFSRVYAAGRGFRAGDEFLARMHGLAPQADLVCAWGEKGAYGLSRGGAPCTSPAFPPPLMVDSLGAGDVFNAGVIHHCLRGAPLERGLIEAARLAGHSCGQHGLEGLVGE
jgi:ketohexokinase